MLLKLSKGMLGLGIVALAMGGWGLTAHAWSCESANCWIRIDEANDPAYQAAIRSLPYNPFTTYSYFYPSYGYSNYMPYPYGGYQYQYQNRYSYSHSQNSRSYWQNGCVYTTIEVNGVTQTTQACGR